MIRNELPYFLMRLSYGAVLLSHGLVLKIFDFTIAGTVSYFAESFGMPPLLSYGVIFGETIGGALIILGIYTRFAALISLPIILGALFVHLGNGWLFSNQGGGWEYPLLLLVMGFACLFGGNGSFALRGIIKRVPLIDALIPEILK
ncbi:MAG: DoxX family protein [Alphaproteobacteria bacterium]|nr:DoxX family protein [Alphaproteobacteria bacterium]